MNEERLPALSDYPLFAGLSEAELAQIAHCLSKRVFGKGAYLYHPGNPAANVYLIESGLVRIFFCDQRGQEYIIQLAGRRSVVGVPMLYDDQTRVMGAAAVQPVVVLVLEKQDLARFAERFPRLMQNIYRWMDQALRNMVQFTQSLVTLDVNGRLAALIMYLSWLIASPQSPDEFEIPLSQAELASWLGTSRGHLNRALAKLQQLGLIRVEGQKLTILDRPGLRRVTEDLLIK